jgi:hypothetical protein
VRELPGVDAASVGGPPRLAPIQSTLDVWRGDDQVPTPSMGMRQSIMPGYFGVMGIPLRAGHDVSDDDIIHQRRVVVVDERLAARLWKREAIGSQLRVGASRQPLEGVGVAGHIRDDTCRLTCTRSSKRLSSTHAGRRLNAPAAPAATGLPTFCRSGPPWARSWAIALVFMEEFMRASRFMSVLVRHRSVLLTALTSAATWIALVQPAGAAPIGVVDLVSPTVQDFTALGLPVSNPTPLVLGGVTYSTEKELLYADFGCASCAFGESLAAGVEDDSWLDVTFSSPVRRAGGYMGTSLGTVSFFGPGNVFLGTVDLGISGFDAPATFAGWEAAGGISRLRFQDLSANGQLMTVDRVMYEGLPVPEPATLSLLGLGLGIGAVRRRLKR